MLIIGSLVGRRVGSIITLRVGSSVGLVGVWIGVLVVGDGRIVGSGRVELEPECFGTSEIDDGEELLCIGFSKWQCGVFEELDDVVAELVGRKVIGGIEVTPLAIYVERDRRSDHDHLLGVMCNGISRVFEQGYHEEFFVAHDGLMLNGFELVGQERLPFEEPIERDVQDVGDSDKSFERGLAPIDLVCADGTGLNAEFLGKLRLGQVSCTAPCSQALAKTYHRDHLPFNLCRHYIIGAIYTSNSLYLLTQGLSYVTMGLKLT